MRILSYATDKSSIAEILTPGYFDDNPFGDDRKLSPGDEIKISTSDGRFETVVESISPVRLETVYSMYVKDMSKETRERWKLTFGTMLSINSLFKE